MTICRKCGHDSGEEDAERAQCCPACGAVYAKVEAHLAAARRRAITQVRRPPALLPGFVTRATPAVYLVLLVVTATSLVLLALGPERLFTVRANLGDAAAAGRFVQWGLSTRLNPASPVPQFLAGMLPPALLLAAYFLQALLVLRRGFLCFRERCIRLPPGAVPAMLVPALAATVCCLLLLAHALTVALFASPYGGASLSMSLLPAARTAWTMWPYLGCLVGPVVCAVELHAWVHDWRRSRATATTAVDQPAAHGVFYGLTLLALVAGIVATIVAVPLAVAFPPQRGATLAQVLQVLLTIRLLVNPVPAMLLGFLPALVGVSMFLAQGVLVVRRVWFSLAADRLLVPATFTRGWRVLLMLGLGSWLLGCLVFVAPPLLGMLGARSAVWPLQVMNTFYTALFFWPGANFFGVTFFVVEILALGEEGWHPGRAAASQPGTPPVGTPD